MSVVRAYVATEADAPLTRRDLDLGPLADHDVELEVEACSLCHSDVHLWADDWGITKFPFCPGHEAVGRIVARGRAVTLFAGGERVGVGWQAGSCGVCVACSAGHANLCTGGKRRTCVDQPGGLATRVRADERFVFRVPDDLSSELAAPLFCAGVTVFAPLRRHHVGPHTRVAVIGLGGLGHLAVQFARGLGAHVTAFDPDAGKADEAKALGAARLSPVDADTLKDLARSSERYDFVLTTTPATLDWDAWLALVALNGTLCVAGIPKGPLTFSADHLIDGQKRVTGSAIGSPEDMRAMLSAAVRLGVRPTIERAPLADAPGVTAALERVRRGAARYRIVLTT
jgi:uncharacterized zinc-type alcohol dehydrogenase-like protein